MWNNLTLGQKLIISALLSFLGLGLAEQIANGLLGTKFIIKDLIDIFQWIFLQVTGLHLIDSGLNSKIGNKPE